MKRLTLCLLLLTLFSAISFAQKSIDQTFDASSAKSISLIFEYPELVKIKVWDKNEINVQGTVDIQYGDHNDDFVLKNSIKSGVLTIESEIKNIDSYKNHTVYTHNDDEEGDKTVTISRNGTTVSVGNNDGRYVNGINISIQLVVTIPRNMEAKIDARYGMVEILNSPQNMAVDAKYGGVDVSLDENQSILLEASTQWGEIFSNLQSSFDVNGGENMGKWINAKASFKEGKGSLVVESQYGNVYLRKLKP